MRLLATACGLVVVAVAYGLVVAAPVPPPSDATVRSAELPRGWDLKEIEEATPPYGAAGTVHVLAWLVQVDDRPLRVETCLVLKDLGRESEHGRWCLAHLYRHPLGEDNTWRLPLPWVSPPPPLGPEEPVAISHAKRFKTRPKNKDVYTSLGDLRWRFNVDKGWKLVSCAVCERNWEAAVGEKPTRFFGDR
ncbi:MAG: hypothetical protein K2X82_09090 [Gemmataceae bacterium]|nr:hypothetical protein [Gemmataceae bacterium]